MESDKKAIKSRKCIYLMNMGIKFKAFLPIKLTEFFFNIATVKDFKALEGMDKPP